MSYYMLITMPNSNDRTTSAYHVSIHGLFETLQHSATYITFQSAAGAFIEEKHFRTRAWIINRTIGGQPIDYPALNSALLHSD
jgi:hypothetical protein